MVETRYEFMAKLHELIKPRGYLEIGVQTGGSLALARCPSVGIDPAPMVIQALHPGVNVHVATSDVYFSNTQWDLPTRVDFAFIDGMHLAEFALRDFINVERIGHSQTIIAFDDVLPYNATIATRVQPPGDWTGDVWKVIDVLKRWRPDLVLTLVDTWPTGTLLVHNINPHDDIMKRQYDFIEAALKHEMEPPHWVIGRTDAVSQDDALKIIGDYLA